MEKPIYKTILESISEWSRCKKLLDKDGINYPELIINRLPKIFGEITIDMKSVITKVPNIVSTASIAKNLDEYQYIICSEVFSLPDNNPMKLELQKYRISIIACFAKLVALLRGFNGHDDDDLRAWNSFARVILVKTSEILVSFRRGQDISQHYSKEKQELSNALNYFGILEEDLKRELIIFYSL
jgi:hypothetical protein